MKGFRLTEEAEKVRREGKDHRVGFPLCLTRLILTDQERKGTPEETRWKEDTPDGRCGVEVEQEWETGPTREE